MNDEGLHCFVLINFVRVYDFLFNYFSVMHTMCPFTFIYITQCTVNVMQCCFITLFIIYCTLTEMLAKHSFKTIL